MKLLALAFALLFLPACASLQARVDEKLDKVCPFAPAVVKGIEQTILAMPPGTDKDKAVEVAGKIVKAVNTACATAAAN